MHGIPTGRIGRRSELAFLRRYLGILLALIRREGILRCSEPMIALMELMEPLFLIAVASFGIAVIKGKTASPLGGSPLLFYATGFFPNYFFIHVSRRMRRFLDGPRRRFSIERRLDHIIVHIIIGTIEYAMLGVLLFGGLYIFITPSALPDNLVPVLQACAAIIMLGFGWGILNLVVGNLWPLWASFFPAVSRLLVVLSGVFFIVDFLRPSMRYVLSFNPMAHEIILFRLGFYPNEPKVVLDTKYLWFCALFAFLMGLVLERNTRRAEE